MSDGECGKVSDGQVFAVLAVVLLFFVVMGMAGSVDISTLKNQFHRKMGILCGIFCQFFLMPCIGFAVCRIVQPPHHVALSMTLVASSPGGAYSNWWCSLFNADLALSVAMTAVSTALSVAMLPLNLTLYVNLLFGTEYAIPWRSLFQSVLTVFTAIVAGIAISTKLPLLKPKMIVIGNVSGITLIMITLFSAFFTGEEQPKDEEVSPPWQKGARTYAVITAVFVVALLTGLLVSSLWFLRLKRPERVAIIIEVCYQNIGIASAVALSAFCHDPQKRSDAATVPLLYGIFQAVVLAFFCIGAWKFGWTYAPVEQRFWQVIVRDFQPVTPSNPVEPTPQESEPPPPAPREGANGDEVDSDGEATFAI